MGNKRLGLWSVVVLALTALAGCNGQAEEDVPLRLGYFPNLTHAPAFIGVSEGYFQDELGDAKLQTFNFNAGPEAVEALFSGALDMSFIGPNPAINAFAESEGEAIRIVAGTTSGGAFLVARDGIEAPSDLAGTKISTPQLGNTQDVALRWWLEGQGFTTTLEGGGDVEILPQANAQILETFISGEIDGAWVPEPWATRMQLEGSGHVLVDEADLWENGQFVTTHLIVRAEFMEQHPNEVSAVLRGLVDAVDFLHGDAATAKQAFNDHLTELTNKPLPQETLDAAWENLEFTVDPIASSLRISAEHAEAVGLLDPVDLDGIYSLDLLNGYLVEAGRDEVSS
jgi:NitT/TauT family transport system substrate-binding protein